MSTRTIVSLAFTVAAGLAIGLTAQTSPANSPAATAARVAAAHRFLASLNQAQTALASYPYNDAKKPTWNNVPPNASRPGVPFRDLTPDQQRLGLEVVRSVLSTYGYEKVQSIIAADDFFGKARDGYSASAAGGGRGPGFLTGLPAYLLAIYGTPSATQPWAVQVNGHHLGVNVAIVSPTQVLTPTLTAAYPNIYEKDGKTIVVLSDEANRALKLQRSLTPAQVEKAVQKTQIWGLVLGPGHDNEVIQPEGLRGAEMTAAQREMLLDVAAAWVNIADDVSARAKMDEIRRNIGDTYWLWSGSSAKPSNAYFRIQGPTVLIEYAPQTMGGGGTTPALYSNSLVAAVTVPTPGQPAGPGRAGAGGVAPGGAAPGPGAQAPQPGGNGRGATDDANRQIDPIHLHTVYRDFTNDYAKKFISAVR